MTAQNTIVIEFPTNTDASLTHQVRNFGEDLWRTIEQEKLGNVEGIDQATSRLVVQIFHSKKQRRVQKLVETLLKQHFLDFRSQVTYK